MQNMNRMFPILYRRTIPCFGLPGGKPRQQSEAQWCSKCLVEPPSLVVDTVNKRCISSSSIPSFGLQARG